MLFPRKRDLSDIGGAVVIWLGVAFSLGWYYTFTWYGRSGWPMPLPEPCASIILYYFSVINASTEIQAVHWMVVFPAAGILWVTVLALTAPFFGGTKTEYAWTVYRFAFTSLPLIAPAPVLMFLAMRTSDGLSFHHMINVALRRGGVTPGVWVTPVYVGLGVACLIWQLFLYVKLFGIKGKKAWQHFLVSLILLVLAAAGLGTLVAFPLRYWLE